MLLSVAILGVVTAVIFPLYITHFYKHFEIQEAIAEMQQQGRFTGDLISREIRQAGYDPTGNVFDPGNVNNIGNPFNNCFGDNTQTARILEARPTAFSFLADLIGDEDINDPNERVRYEWVDAWMDTNGQRKDSNKNGIIDGHDICDKIRDEYTLYRSTGRSMQPASTNIESLDFSYFDEDENPIPNDLDADGNLVQSERDRIRKVVLTVIARTDRSDPDYRDDGGALKNDGYRTRTFIYEIWLRNM